MNDDTINNDPWLLDLPVTPRFLDHQDIPPVGFCRFDKTIRMPDIVTPRDALARTATAFPGEFILAEQIFAPEEWRLLLYLDSFRWSLLCDPTFDPSEYIRHAIDGVFGMPPSNFVGADPDLILAGLIKPVTDCDRDTAKAVWLILSFVRSLVLSQAEVLQLEWWRRSWWREALHGQVVV